MRTNPDEDAELDPILVGVDFIESDEADEEPGHLPELIRAGATSTIDAVPGVSILRKEDEGYTGQGLAFSRGPSYFSHCSIMGVDVRLYRRTSLLSA